MFTASELNLVHRLRHHPVAYPRRDHSCFSNKHHDGLNKGTLSPARLRPQPRPHPRTARRRGDPCRSHPAARVTAGLVYSVTHEIVTRLPVVVIHLPPLSFFPFWMYCSEYCVFRISVRVTTFVAGAETKITLRMYDTSVTGGTRRRH